MKSLATILTLFMVISMTNNSLAIGFPHNLFSTKKSEKKEMKSRNISTTETPHKTIMLKSSRFVSISGKVLQYAFARKAH
jgi:hypothetical protein